MDFKPNEKHKLFRKINRTMCVVLLTGNKDTSHKYLASLWFHYKMLEKIIIRKPNVHTLKTNLLAGMNDLAV